MKPAGSHGQPGEKRVRHAVPLQESIGNCYDSRVPL